MPDYQLMYKTLFQAIAQTIDILQQAQQTTEEIYISADEPIITLLPQGSGSEKEIPPD